MSMKHNKLNVNKNLINGRFIFIAITAKKKPP